MEFNYFNYKDNMISKVYSKNRKKDGIIFIFNSELTKLEALKKYGDYFLFENNLHFTVEEFKEEIFLTDKILIREEKRVVAFYRALSDEYKKKHKVKNYFDIIDNANNFFSFYKELSEAEVFSLEDLSPWQEKIYNDFENIKENYREFLMEKSLEDRIFLYNIKNVNYDYIKKYEKIIFINTVDFSKLEKTILSDLDKDLEIEFNMKMKEGDFNEENLCIDVLNFPEKDFDITVKIYKDPVVQYISLIDEMKSSDKIYSIFDPLYSSYDYNGFLSSDFFQKNKRIEFSKTEIFKFFNLLYELLDRKNIKNIKVNSKLMLKAMQNSYFRGYFRLSLNDYKLTLKYLSEGYKYFDIENKKFNYLNSIFEELKILSSMDNIEKISSYFEKIELKRFDNERYFDLEEHYYSAIFELRAIETLNLVESWEDFFDKNDEIRGIFRLFLKYLRFKKVKVKNGEKKNFVFKSLEEFDEKKNDNLYIINASDGILDKVKFNGFLLNDNQRENIGLKTSEKMKKTLEYNFYKMVFSSEKIIVSGIKNIAKNIDLSPFVEKLIINYSLEREGSRYTDRDYRSFAEELFDYKKIESSDEEMSKFEIENINKEKLSLGYYDISILTSCEYKYYLKAVLKIEEIKKEISSKLEAKDLGILIHDLLDTLSEFKKEDIFNKDFLLNNEVLEKEFSEKLYKHRYKMPQNYDLFYKDILYPLLKDGIDNFYNKLKYVLKDEKIINYYSEKSSEEKEILFDKIKFVAKARADLRIETDKNRYIIDYKTGGGKSEQLNFYNWLYYDNNKSENYIYSVTESKFEKGSDKDFEIEDYVDVFKEIIKRRNFKKTDKKSYCKTCEYLDICRPR